jgi:tetratricopeptide (TPR) repeat protein
MVDILFSILDDISKDYLKDFIKELLTYETPESKLKLEVRRLSKELKNAKNPIYRAKISYKLALLYANLKEISNLASVYDSSELNVANELAKNLDEIIDTQELISYYVYLIYFFSDKDYTKSKYFYVKLLDLIPKISITDLNKAKIYHIIANIELNKNSELSKSFIDKALEIDSNNNKFLLTKAIILYKLNNTTKANELFKEIIDKFTFIEDNENLSKSYYYLSKLYKNNEPLETKYLQLSYNNIKNIDTIELNRLKSKILSRLSILKDDQELATQALIAENKAIKNYNLTDNEELTTNEDPSGFPTLAIGKGKGFIWIDDYGNYKDSENIKVGDSLGFDIHYYGWHKGMKNPHLSPKCNFK